MVGFEGMIIVELSTFRFDADYYIGGVWICEGRRRGMGEGACFRCGGGV